MIRKRHRSLWSTPYEERFWSRVEKGEDCWIWTGARHWKGYGHLVWKEKKALYTHRISWMLHNGPIPEGMQVCHHCDNPPCVNPAHLFLGTNADNQRDSMVKGRSRSPVADRNRAKTHCKRGHEFTEENTIRDANKRKCRICHNAGAKRRWREQRRSA